MANIAAETAGKFKNMQGASFINMNSLEAMAENCRTLCMKMWTDYEYKYVEIINMTYDKHGAEDDVFRVSLSLKETPVLTLSPLTPGYKTKTANPNWAVKVIGTAQHSVATPLIELTNVREAAGSDGGDAGTIKNTLARMWGG